MPRATGLGFLAAFAAVALLLASPVDAQMRGKRGQFGGKPRGGMVKRDPADIPAELRNSAIQPQAAREIHEHAGLITTGVEPVYPKDAKCLDVKSPFGSKTRYDGSWRAANEFHGYHSGTDISADEGTPLIAIADGEVVHKYSGGQLVGHQIFLRHSPADTGLNFWVYSKYKHFRELPALEIGAKVKMGQVIGYSGKTGTVGGHYGRAGYPHLHLTLYVTESDAYNSFAMTLLPENFRYLDLVALYLVAKRPDLADNHKLAALPKADRKIEIPYAISGGRAVPDGTRLVWPFACAAS